MDGPEIDLLHTVPTAKWWRTPLIPALGKQRQADLCEFEASLVKRYVFQPLLKLGVTMGINSDQ